MRVAHRTKNNKKSLPEPVGQSFPQIWRLNPVLKLVGLGYREVWDTLWCLLAGFGALLGGSWLLLGSPEQALGTYLAALGRLLAGLPWISPPLSSLSKEVWRPHNMMTCPGFLAWAVRLLWTVVLALAAPQKG